MIQEPSWRFGARYLCAEAIAMSVEYQLMRQDAIGRAMTTLSAKQRASLMGDLRIAIVAELKLHGAFLDS